MKYCDFKQILPNAFPDDMFKDRWKVENPIIFFILFLTFYSFLLLNCINLAVKKKIKKNKENMKPDGSFWGSEEHKLP